MVTVVFKLTDVKLESSEAFSLNQGKDLNSPFPSIFLMSAQSNSSH